MKKNKGFTLIELLVVISIIALLLAILMPGLQRAKELASGVVCTNNEKSLCTAWVMYAEDNDSNIVGGSTYKSGHQQPTPYRWVEPPMDEPIYGGPESSIANYSQRTRNNGIRAGKLFTYLENEKTYHCPGDRTNRNPEPDALYRSYGITGLMNGEDFPPGARAGNNEFNPITEYRKVNLDGKQRTLKCITKSTEVSSPALKLVFVEEDANTWHKQPYNKGSWVLLSQGYTWWDGPAGYHADGSTMGFADGHAERYKWKDEDTLALINEGTTDPDMQNNEDLRYLARGYIPGE